MLFKVFLFLHLRSTKLHFSPIMKALPDNKSVYTREGITFPDAALHQGRATPPCYEIGWLVHLQLSCTQKSLKACLWCCKDEMVKHGQWPATIPDCALFSEERWRWPGHEAAAFLCLADVEMSKPALTSLQSPRPSWANSTVRLCPACCLAGS